MTPMLILKAFGNLPSTDLIEFERERERREWIDPPKSAVEVGILLRAFEARAELLGWAGTSSSINSPQPLWNVFEAGLIDSEDDPSLIGWVYAGVANQIDLSKVTPEMIQPGTGVGWAAIKTLLGYAEFTIALPAALPPFVQCLDDALRHIGATDVFGYQLTCHQANLQPRQRNQGYLRSGVAWFSVPTPDATAVDAVVAFDSGFLGSHQASKIVPKVVRRGNELFKFKLSPDIPDLLRIKAPGSSIIQSVVFEPSNLGLSVRMPEWSASAAGWVLATIIDAAHAIAPDVENFAVRITRVL